MGTETELKAPNAIDLLQKYTSLDKVEDQIFLKSEIEEITILLHQEQQNTNTKYEIIRSAAKKLQNQHNYTDPSIISSRLKQIFKPLNNKDPSISQATVERSLEYTDDTTDYTKFKRSYTKSDIITKPTRFQEIMAIMEDCANTIKELSHDLGTKANDPKINADLDKELETILLDLHTNIDSYTKKFIEQIHHLRDYSSLTDFLKNLSLDLISLKELTDDRKRLQSFMKLNLKTLMICNSMSSLAKRFNMSSKSMSMINKDGYLIELVHLMRLCPDCGMDTVHFANRVKIAFDMNLPVPKPTRFFFDVNNPIEQFDIKHVTIRVLSNIPDDINFCSYSICQHRLKLQEQDNHCTCNNCKSKIENELNPHRCPCEICIEKSKFILTDKIAEQFYTDNNGIKHRKLYHPECLRKQKQHETKQILKSVN